MDRSGSDSVTFPVVSSITIVHDVTFSGGLKGFVAGATITNQFGETGIATVPEPATFPLFAARLLAAIGIDCYAGV